MEPFVDGFVQTDAGPVPRVRTRLLPGDRLGTLRVRIGHRRAGYKVVPGLYCVGAPGPDSPVLVTANYKLSFDALRTRLAGIDAWLLAADTRGINVWCAAGKALFDAREVCIGVGNARLNEIVSHRELILPQLAATGVAAREVSRGCGFKVVYGPVRAEDVPAFLKADNTATEAMRTVTFPLRERAALIPVELYLFGRPLAWIAVAAFLLSGIGPDVFSLRAAWTRGLLALGATLAGVLSGSVAVPLLLDRLPGRQFWPKGALTGMIAGAACAPLAAGEGVLGTAALVLWATAVSAYLAMNFTGSTPFTSPSGVEREMRRGIPALALTATAAVLCWLAAPFAN